MPGRCMDTANDFASPPASTTGSVYLFTDAATGPNTGGVYAIYLPLERLC